MRITGECRPVIGAAIGGLVGGIAIATSWKFHIKPEKDAVDILTAVGTLAAAVIALGIALKDEFLRRMQATARARLTAAAVVLPLMETVREVDTIAALFAANMPRNISLVTYADLKSRLDRIALDISREQLADLSALRNNVAYNIVVCNSQLELARKHAAAALSIFSIPATAEQKQAAMEAIHQCLPGVAIVLDRAVRECQAAQLAMLNFEERAKLRAVNK